MKYRKIKAMISSIAVVVAMLCTSVPAYAEEMPDSVIETVETSPSDLNDSSDNQPIVDDNLGGEQNDTGEVIELTVTVTEVTPSPESQSETSTTEEEKSQEVQSEENGDETFAIDNGETPDESTSVTSNFVNDDVENQKSDKLNEQYQDVFDHYDSETRTSSSNLNYEKVLSDVSVSESSTGRYNAIFTITETETTSGSVKYYNYTVSGFATEESARAYASAVESREGWRGGETVYAISDDSYVDAEKRPVMAENEDIENGDYGDSDLCWAGSVSNMLELSGWNKVTNHNYNNEDVSDEDALFDFFAKKFTNKAGNIIYGLEWFFNGDYTPQGEIYANNWSQVRNNEDLYVNAMLKEYCSADFITPYGSGNLTEQTLTEALKSINADEDGDRCIIGLTIGFYSCDDNGDPLCDENGNQERYSGHAVTIVGYSTDENGVPNTITIIDSDSYNGGGIPSTPADNRRDYQNSYKTLPLEYHDGHCYVMNYINNKFDVIIDELRVLKYYSDNTKDIIEDEDATLDLVNDYDLFIHGNYLLYEGKYTDGITVYQDEELCGAFQFYNRGLRDENTLEGNTLTYKFIISKDGEEYKVLNYSDILDGVDGYIFNQYCNIIMNSENPLEEGEYTVSYLINYDKSIKEAYYNNNDSKFVNRFIVIKRETPSGKVDYVVIPEPSNVNNTDDNTGDNNDNNNDDQRDVVTEFDIYQQLLSIFMSNVKDYSAVTKRSAFENNNQTFEFNLSHEVMTFNVSDTDLTNAKIVFDYSTSGDITLANGSFGGNITSGIVITKDDYKIVKKSDGSISIIFSNAFMKKLPKGVHYFKLKIAGQTRIFRIEVK